MLVVIGVIVLVAAVIVGMLGVLRNAGPTLQTTSSTAYSEESTIARPRSSDSTMRRGKQRPASTRSTSPQSRAAVPTPVPIPH
ncbi:MAG: hypothetical protein QOI01_5438 [Mycobacterium sp.]|nr:hypothetical protein [Mycobacterium sp.]